MTDIVLPYKFKPRFYQIPILRKLDDGVKRAVAVWHRRSGKEKTFINYMIKKAVKRKGTYFYFFPTYTQAKKAIWNGMDREGFPFLGHFPQQIIKKKNESDLKIELINSSVFQLIGADSYDSVMSTNPIGCVFAEYSLQDPKAWDYMRPILRENGGWAIFDYTPRGKNHGMKLYQMAKKLMQSGDSDWYCEKLTVEDTRALSQADLDAERREGMSDEMIQQEYYCSFEGIQEGSIFGKQVELAEREKRICPVPWQPEFAVSTWWDIGTKDPCAIWFTQDIGREIHVIDYYENSGIGVGVDHYIKYLQGLPYIWGTHNGPHDIEAHSFAAGGKSTKEVAQALGFRFQTVDRHERHDGINAARSFMSRCYFDANKCEKGLDALRSYHYQWIDERKCFSTEPYHDWASNGSDAFRYLSMGHKYTPTKKAEQYRPRVIQLGEGSTRWMGS